jgi:carbon storage regulator
MPEGEGIDCGTEAPLLVLTRKSNQSIMIGDEIEVSVLAIMGEKVRIGIEAPRSIPVFRREVYLEIQQDTSPEEARKEVDQALERMKGGTGPEPAGEPDQ